MDFSENKYTDYSPSEDVHLEFSYWLNNFYPQDRRSGAYCFCLVCHSLILSYCHSALLWNYYLANNFWTLSARALIFHMIPCDTCKIFCRLLELLEKSSIGQNFLKIKIKASIMQMVISCDKILFTAYHNHIKQLFEIAFLLFFCFQQQKISYSQFKKE